jgi:hypothetical protein
MPYGQIGQAISIAKVSGMAAMQAAGSGYAGGAGGMQDVCLRPT